jgi:hypothetical protein
MKLFSQKVMPERKSMVISWAGGIIWFHSKKYVLLCQQVALPKWLPLIIPTNPFTIYKKIYFPKKEEWYVGFTLKEKTNTTVFIIDESSMISDDPILILSCMKTVRYSMILILMCIEEPIARWFWLVHSTINSQCNWTSINFEQRYVAMN